LISKEQFILYLYQAESNAFNQPLFLKVVMRFFPQKTLKSIPFPIINLAQRIGGDGPEVPEEKRVIPPSGAFGPSPVDVSMYGDRLISCSSWS